MPGSRLGRTVASMSRAPVDRRLADDPAARRAVIALGLFSLAEQAVWVTVLVIAHRSGGVAEAGTVSAALMLPAAVVAPFAAREVHDSGLRHPLPASYAMQTGALVLATATLALGLDPIVFYLSAAMVTVTVVFSRPAHHAVLARHGSTVAATVATPPFSTIRRLYLILDMVLFPLLLWSGLEAVGPPLIPGKGHALARRFR